MLLDLVLPLECGGCGAPATRWCDACASALAVRPDHPRVVTPRVDPGVPVLSLGRYAGARREAIVAVKEHGRADLVAPLSGALAAGLQRLVGWGVVDLPLTVVPAPTRRSAARRRGGDPVTRIAVAAVGAHPGVRVVRALRVHGFARDSVGLSGAARQANLAGRIRVRRAVTGTVVGAVVLVDDIVTTGATAAESVRALANAGVPVAAVLALANA